MWTGVGDGVGDTPQTVMTTRAPAVLKTFAILEIFSAFDKEYRI